MAETAIADIRANFDISESDIGDDAVSFALTQSIREAKQRIGASVYADLTATEPSDELQAESLAEAVSLLTVSRLLANKYLRFRREGLVKREQSTESAGMGSNNVTNEYLDVDQQVKLSKQLREMAFDSLKLAGLETLGALWTIAVCNPTGTDDLTIPQKTSSEYAG